MHLANGFTGGLCAGGQRRPLRLLRDMADEIVARKGHRQAVHGVCFDCRQRGWNHRAREMTQFAVVAGAAGHCITIVARHGGGRLVHDSGIGRRDARHIPGKRHRGRHRTRDGQPGDHPAQQESAKRNHAHVDKDSVNWFACHVWQGKLQHWCGLQAKNGLEGAPLLEFCCLVDPQPCAPLIRQPRISALPPAAPGSAAARTSRFASPLR